MNTAMKGVACYALFGATLAFTLGGCATPSGATRQTSNAAPIQTFNAPRFDAGVASRNIRVGMTEAQLTTAIGWPPNQVDMSTCGQAVGKPWQCKILTFGTMGNQLMVMMETTTNSNSVVNSWKVMKW